MVDIHKIEQLAAASWAVLYSEKHGTMASQSQLWCNQKGEQRMDFCGYA